MKAQDIPGLWPVTYRTVCPPILRVAARLIAQAFGLITPMDGVKNPLRFLSVLLGVRFQPEFPESGVRGVNPAEPPLRTCTTLPIDPIVG